MMMIMTLLRGWWCCHGDGDAFDGEKSGDDNIIAFADFDKCDDVDFHVNYDFDVYDICDGFVDDVGDNTVKNHHDM